MCPAVGDDSAVRKMSERKTTPERKAANERKASESRQFARQAYNTSSTRTVRTGQPLVSDRAQYRLQEMMLMRDSMRMHRNPLLYNRPFAMRHSTLAHPIPSDWTTVSSLRARRRPDARIPRDDSYISASEPDHESVGSKTLAPAVSEVQEPLPVSATEQLSSSPPVPVRQRRNRRRRAPVDVDNNNSLVNGVDSSRAANENEEPQLIDVTTPQSTNVSTNETDVDSVLSDTSTQQYNDTKASRPSMVFEKVLPEVVEPVVKNRRHVTERRLPLQESSV